MFFQQLEAQRLQRQQEQERAQALSAKQQADANAHLKQTVHEGVASYLREGKCKEAVDLALQYSEIELAGQAKAFCAAPSP